MTAKNECSTTPIATEKINKCSHVHGYSSKKHWHRKHMLMYIHVF